MTRVCETIFQVASFYQCSTHFEPSRIKLLNICKTSKSTKRQNRSITARETTVTGQEMTITVWFLTITAQYHVMKHYWRLRIPTACLFRLFKFIAVASTSGLLFRPEIVSQEAPAQLALPRTFLLTKLHIKLPKHHNIHNLIPYVASFPFYALFQSISHALAICLQDFEGHLVPHPRELHLQFWKRGEMWLSKLLLCPRPDILYPTQIGRIWWPIC